MAVCEFGRATSAATRLAHPRKYETHEAAHADGECARLWAKEHNPSGEPLHSAPAGTPRKRLAV